MESNVSKGLLCLELTDALHKLVLVCLRRDTSLISFVTLLVAGYTKLEFLVRYFNKFEVYFNVKYLPFKQEVLL